MSLEKAILDLTEIMTKVYTQNETVIALAQDRAGSKTTSSADAIAAAAATKSAPTKKAATTKKTETAEDGVTKAALTGGLSAWMNEFGKPADHVESGARHAALKSVLTKLKIASLKDLAEDDNANIDKLYNWLENTAKKADKGHGIGLLVAPPEATEEDTAAEEDDMGI